MKLGRKSIGNPQKGYTYILLLIGIAILSLGISMASEIWSSADQRQKKIESEWIGEQYIQALSSYYYSGSSGIFTAPTKIEQLLEDNRFTPPRRHLRQKYKNPFSKENCLPIYDGSFITGFRITEEYSQENYDRKFIFNKHQDKQLNHASN